MAFWTGAASRPALNMLQDPHCVVPAIACTGDWFGGWEAVVTGDVNQFITGDLKGGRIIRRGEPAVRACHWPGIYFNGTESGFRNFQEVVRRLHADFDNPVWRKNGEIARPWAAKVLTWIEAGPGGLAGREQAAVLH